MNKNILFLLSLCFFFVNCDKNSVNTNYTGNIKIITETHGVTSSENIYDINTLKIEDETFKRDLNNSNKNCVGEVIWENETVEFKSSDCSCHCDCSPLADCLGDLILGKYDIIENQDGKLHLEGVKQTLAIGMNGNPSYARQKTLYLEIE